MTDIDIPLDDEEEELLRSVAIQNARSILLARQRADEELVAAKEALERRTAELESANSLIRTITENATSCLVMVDERGVPTYMNPSTIEQTGYTPEEFMAAPLHDLLHPPIERDGHSFEDCPFRRARESLVPLKDYRDSFLRKDGSTFPVLCSLSPLEQQGRASGAVLDFRDITRELAARKALEDANRRKDQFLATLSHELRTPMTAVLGWAGMLKLGLPEDEAREAIDAIERSAVIQAHLIDDVLDVSLIVAGKLTFTPVPINAAPVIHAAMTTVHPAAAAKDITIAASVPDALPAILGDEGRLQQIVWNLLSNAVKFTARGGRIEVRAEHIGSILSITVEDTGRGIEPEYLPHIFETFSQQDPSMTRAHEGIGLGLSIVRSLVDLHGGRIRVASEGPGKGAAFTVELPIIESSPAVNSLHARSNPSTSRTVSLPDLAGLSILVIDDHESTRNLILAVFRRAGADVHPSSSAQEGLDELRKRRIDVVVCDLAMPVEDGYAFIAALRALPSEARATPVVALTAFGRPEDRLRVLAAGFDAYLKKPVDPEELATAVLRAARPKP